MSQPAARSGGQPRAAVAGAVAALVWALQEPLDQRALRCDYSDVAVLGKALVRGRGWRAAGLAARSASSRKPDAGHRFQLVFARKAPRIAIFDFRFLICDWKISL